MLEFGRQIAFEVVLDDEDVEEIGIAAGAEDVPGQGSQTERGDCDGMKQTERVAPPPSENCPEENRAAGQDNRSGTFGEYREPEKKTK